MGIGNGFVFLVALVRALFVIDIEGGNLNKLFGAIFGWFFGMTIATCLGISFDPHATHGGVLETFSIVFSGGFLGAILGLAFVRLAE